MLKDIRESIFVQKYLIDCVEDGVSIGQVYKDIFEPEGTEDIRVYVGKGKKLIKTKRIMEEVARFNFKEDVDTASPDNVKDFVSKELLNLYMTASSVIPSYDRNGKAMKNKTEFMDSSVAKASLELLGKSVGMFKEVNENVDKHVTVTLGGVDISEVAKKKDSFSRC